jgi:hypothetical protein
MAELVDGGKCLAVCRCRTDRNADELGRLGRRSRKHMALPVEYPSRLDHQRGRVNFRGNDRIGLDLNARCRLNRAGKPAPNNDSVSRDFALDQGMLAQNKRAIRNQGALDGRIDSERTGAFKPPFEPCAFFKEPGPFTVIASI